MTLWERAAGLWRRVPPRTRTRLLRLTNHKVTLGVVGLVHDAEGRVLVLEHRFRPGSPWGLPGGYLKAGEALEGALERELLEETRLVVEVDPTPIDVEHRVGVGMLTIALAARVRDGELVLSSEIRGGGFFAPSALPPETYPRHLALVARWASARERRDVSRDPG